MQIKQQLIENIENNLLKLEEQGLKFEDILEILKKREEKRKTIPLSIFNNSYLSALEAIVKYLKENLALNYQQISSLLNRNYDPIAITYRNSKKKMPGKLTVSGNLYVHLTIFSNKKLSILENLVSYLKEEVSLTYHEIALHLNRDDRTIWTVYQRAIKKQR